MRIPHVISSMAGVLFVALGAACLSLDVLVRNLRIDVGSQEQLVLSVEDKNVELTRAWQALEEKKERQEQANQALRREVLQKQAALQMQQEQINQSATIVQQIAPNLLRDMAEASVKNEKMKQLLAKHGYTVQSK